MSARRVHVPRIQERDKTTGQSVEEHRIGWMASTLALTCRAPISTKVTGNRKRQKKVLEGVQGQHGSEPSLDVGTIDICGYMSRMLMLECLSGGRRHEVKSQFIFRELGDDESYSVQQVPPHRAGTNIESSSMCAQKEPVI